MPHTPHTPTIVEGPGGASRYLLHRGTAHTLDYEDQLWAMTSGPARRAANVRHGCHYPPYINESKRDALQLERIGCGGEIAFARMVGVQPTMLVEQWATSPNGWLPDGRPYDVTCTTLVNGQLLIPKRGRPRREWIYVLLLAQWPTYRFLGWREGTVLIRNEWLVRPVWKRQSWAYGMSQRQLRATLEYW